MGHAFSVGSHRVIHGQGHGQRRPSGAVRPQDASPHSQSLYQPGPHRKREGREGIAAQICHSGADGERAWHQGTHGAPQGEQSYPAARLHLDKGHFRSIIQLVGRGKAGALLRHGLAEENRENVAVVFNQHALIAVIGRHRCIALFGGAGHFHFRILLHQQGTRGLLGEIRNRPRHSAVYCTIAVVVDFQTVARASGIKARTGPRRDIAQIPEDFPGGAVGVGFQHTEFCGTGQSRAEFPFKNARRAAGQLGSFSPSVTGGLGDSTRLHPGPGATLQKIQLAAFKS